MRRIHAPANKTNVVRSVNESDFNQRVDDVLIAIEDAVDKLEVEIDCEEAGGILTLTFENDSKIIINRQTPLKQIWVAAKSGGFHFDYDPQSDQWLNDNDRREFFAALSAYCTEQAGEPVSIYTT